MYHEITNEPVTLSELDEARATLAAMRRIARWPDNTPERQRIAQKWVAEAGAEVDRLTLTERDQGQRENIGGHADLSTVESMSDGLAPGGIRTSPVSSSLADPPSRSVSVGSLSSPHVAA